MFCSSKIVSVEFYNDNSLELKKELINEILEEMHECQIPLTSYEFNFELFIITPKKYRISFSAEIKKKFSRESLI